MFDPLSFQTGMDGFVWWIGVVEGHGVTNPDPMKLGRAKVRIIGWHGTNEEISTSDLPWAIPLAPVTHGHAPVPTFKNGDWVVGFFLDGKLGQQPMVCWVMPSIPQGGFLGGLVKNVVKKAIKSQTGIDF